MLAFPLLGAALVATFSLGGRGKAKWRVALLALAALLLSWGLAEVFARLDPGRVLAWYLD